MNGAQSLFKALVDAGVTTCFANPGTSEMQLVYEIGMTDKVRPILCLQEDVVTGAADGYARMTARRPSRSCMWAAVSGMAPPCCHAGRAIPHRQCRRRERNLPSAQLPRARTDQWPPNRSRPRGVALGEGARSASNLGELGAEAAALRQNGQDLTIVRRPTVTGTRPTRRRSFPLRWRGQRLPRRRSRGPRRC